MSVNNIVFSTPWFNIVAKEVKNSLSHCYAIVSGTPHSNYKGIKFLEKNEVIDLWGIVAKGQLFGYLISIWDNPQKKAPV
ncbi:MAG: hypothetical protein A2W74_09970 [Planctomycetes bacterium RIFCSPLOWO2_12_38_17]|nr:MAG: hypothetical protein A2W74_09970 [Planctomycetes bacterium RIFCSPLOWO2_12_38_17]